MTSHPRWWRPDAIYSEVKRTVDRQFFLKPSPEVRNIIGACLGRAQRRFPVKLYWAEANINHMQIGKSAGPGELKNLSRFDQLFTSLLTRELNRLYDREGPLWSTRNRSTICLDDPAAEQQLFYTMTNPVKDGLCEKVKHWSQLSFSSYSQLAEGKTEKFPYINWTKWHNAGGVNSKKKPEEFTEHVEVKFTPLPHLADLPIHKREEYVRREIRKIEQAEREIRRTENRPAMTRARLLKTDPRDRPKSEPVRTPKPLCHASSVGRRNDYREEWKEFLTYYRYASGQYRMGMLNAEFPDGSFRPPMIEVCVNRMRC